MISDRCDGVEDLLAKILQGGVVNPQYYRDPCAQTWAGYSGLNIQKMWVLAHRKRGWPEKEIPRYQPLRICADRLSYCLIIMKSRNAERERLASERFGVDGPFVQYALSLRYRNKEVNIEDAGFS